LSGRLQIYWQKKKDRSLKGYKLLINAGPTREMIDPVRFISNYSTGKMGIAIANAASAYGADVELVLGPVEIIPDNSVKVINVTSAQSMAEECISRFAGCDIAVLAAAVADYTPLKPSGSKIKKEDTELVLKLKPTIDIASELGKRKKKGQLLAGFSLETDNELENAISKLKKKNLDLIVLNSLKDKNAGFGFDTNRITIIDRDNNIDKFELKSKEEAAEDIIDKIISMMA
jgi:phosphopantothenoylcysteine decarboxylase / phosphopantothenate---cysteine ligase